MVHLKPIETQLNAIDPQITNSIDPKLSSVQFSLLFEGKCIGPLWDLFGSFSSSWFFFSRLLRNSLKMFVDGRRMKTEF